MQIPSQNACVKQATPILLVIYAACALQENTRLLSVTKNALNVLPNSRSEQGAISIDNFFCVAGYTKENKNPCIPCASGKYESQEGNEPCVLCARGKYKTHPGPGSCNNSCPEKSDSETSGISISDRLCQAGSTQVSGTMCILYAAGKYKTTLGDQECSECLADQYSETICDTVNTWIVQYTRVDQKPVTT